MCRPFGGRRPAGECVDLRTNLASIQVWHAVYWPSAVIPNWHLFVLGHTALAALLQPPAKA